MQQEQTGQTGVFSGIKNTAGNLLNFLLPSESKSNSAFSAFIDKYGESATFLYLAENLVGSDRLINNKALSGEDYFKIFGSKTTFNQLDLKKQSLEKGENWYTLGYESSDTLPEANTTFYQLSTGKYILDGKVTSVSEILTLLKEEQRHKIAQSLNKAEEKYFKSQSEVVALQAESSDEEFATYSVPKETTIFPRNFGMGESDKKSALAETLASPTITTVQPTATFLSTANPNSGPGQTSNPNLGPPPPAWQSSGSFQGFNPGNQGFTFGNPPQQPVQAQPLNPVNDYAALAQVMMQMMGQRNQPTMTEFGVVNQAPSKKWEEAPSFESLKLSSSTSSRQPKNMRTIFAAFCSFYKKESVTEAKAWPFDFTKGLYTEYILGAKDKKAQLKTGKGYQKIPFADNTVACVVRIGKPQEGIRTDVTASQPVFTYPDFCACISLRILFEEFANRSTSPAGTICKNWAPAPLAANIYNEREEFKNDGYHICGHSGLASVVNYFWGKKKANDPWGPSVANLVQLGALMDLQSKGNLGKNATKEQIARTCGSPASELMAGVWPDKWVVQAQTTQAARTASDINDLSKMVNVNFTGGIIPGNPPNTNPGGNSGPTI